MCYLLGIVAIIFSSYTFSANLALISAGEKQGAVCQACHKVGPDAGVSVGPPLWGLAERNIGSYAGYSYSEGLAGRHVKWDPSKLELFLTSPDNFASGTRMVYPGVSDAVARAAIIAWLGTLNDKPVDWEISVNLASLEYSGERILKPGADMDLVATKCNGCHSLHLVKQQGLSLESWRDTLEWMVEEQGMDEIGEPELSKILSYLATNYGIAK